MLNCKHCRYNIQDGQKSMLVRATGKTGTVWRAYVHQTCRVDKIARDMFGKALLVEVGVR